MNCSDFKSHEKDVQWSFNKLVWRGVQLLEELRDGEEKGKAVEVIDF